MALILSLKRPKGSMTTIMISAKDGNASRKIDILAAFDDTPTNREIVVCRAMTCKAPIHAEKWDDVLKDQDKIDAAFYQLCTYLNEFNSQMTKVTAKAAPAQHAVAETKYDDDLGNPFGGIAACSLPLQNSISRKIWMLCWSSLVSTSRANASSSALTSMSLTLR
jgi:hypothetical protein